MASKSKGAKKLTIFPDDKKLFSKVTGSSLQSPLQKVIGYQPTKTDQQRRLDLRDRQKNQSQDSFVADLHSISESNEEEDDLAEPKSVKKRQQKAESKVQPRKVTSSAAALVKTIDVYQKSMQEICTSNAFSPDLQAVMLEFLTMTCPAQIPFATEKVRQGFLKSKYLPGFIQHIRLATTHSTNLFTSLSLVDQFQLIFMASTALESDHQFLSKLSMLANKVFSMLPCDLVYDHPQNTEPSHVKLFSNMAITFFADSSEQLACQIPLLAAKSLSLKPFISKAKEKNLHFNSVIHAHVSREFPSRKATTVYCLIQAVLFVHSNIHKKVLVTLLEKNMFDDVLIKALDCWDFDTQTKAVRMLTDLTSCDGDMGSLAPRLLAHVNAQDQVVAAFLSKSTRSGFEKISPIELVALLDAFVQTSLASRNDLLKQEQLNGLLKHIQTNLSTRVSLGINQEKIDTYVQNFCSTAKESFRTVFKAIDDISKALAARNQNFRHLSFQSLVATRMAVNTNKAVFLKLGPGQGKTFILLLLALYLSRTLKKSVVIVVPDDVLLSHFVIITSTHCPTDQLFVVKACDVDKFAKRDVFLIDEADFVLNEHMLVFKQGPQHLAGLSSIIGKQIYCLSATSNLCTENIICSLFSADSQTFSIDQQSMYMISTQKEGHIQLTTAPLDSRIGQVVYQNVLKQVGQLLLEGPVVVFLGELDSEIQETLSRGFKAKGIRHNFVINSETAIKTIKEIANKKDVVVVLDRKFSRGVDLKFCADATTIVVDNKSDVTLDEVYQMVGRSNRTFGMCKGVVMMFPEDDPFANVVGVLEGRNVANFHVGAELIPLIIKAYEKAAPKGKKELAAAFSGKGWQLTWPMLAVKQAAIYALLRAVQAELKTN